MLTSLLELFETLDVEDEGWVCIEEAHSVQRNLAIQLNLSRSGETTFKRTVLCHEPRSHFLVAVEEAENLRLCDDHVVLWPHTQLDVELYFNGRVDDAFSLLGGLVDAHYRNVGDWFPFTRFMNDALLSPRVDLFDGGSGLLAKGPQALIDAYATVLDEFGIRHSSPPPHKPFWWDGNQWHTETDTLYALIMGRSYAVAPEFTEMNV